MAGVSGVGLGILAGGGLFLYGAIRGKSPLQALQSVVQGQSPSAVPQTAPISGEINGVPSSTTGSPDGDPSGLGGPTSGAKVRAILHGVAAVHGWGAGAEWKALENIEMAEAGYRTNARNASGALGIAQALGHGQGAATAGTLGNEYGGYGLNAKEARAANSGSAYWQAIWMCTYIHDRYGTPVNAWKFHQANNSY